MLTMAAVTAGAGLIAGPRLKLWSLLGATTLVGGISAGICDGVSFASVIRAAGGVTVFQLAAFAAMTLQTSRT
jgi:hypothetical protein